MTTFFAEFISVLFHPILLCLSMPFLVVYRQTGNSEAALKWGLFSAIFILGAGIWVFWEHFAGKLSDYDLSKRRERRLFYAIAMFLAVVYLSLSVIYGGIFSPLSMITVGIIIGIIFFELVNTKIKASVHIGIASAWIVSLGILFGKDMFLLIWWILFWVSLCSFLV
jgi:hypothetical protein